MTLTGPNRDEVFQWDPSEPELMKAMILVGVQIQMPITPLRYGRGIVAKPEGIGLGRLPDIKKDGEQCKN
jgi:hypothetical protein